jgi:hypothetical protein
MLLLKWVIDRLHYTYHRGCRDSTSGWYVSGVDPAEHPRLAGVDTEACEQLFHIANRWQVVLSNTAPVHQELFLLVFAREHNKYHSCASAVAKYRAAILSDVAPKPRAAVSPASGNASASDCDVGERSKKKKKVVHAAACSAEAVDAGSSGDVIVGNDGFAGDSRSDRWAVVNTGSKTMHSVILKKDVYTECSWSFQGRAQVCPRESLRGKGYWRCGVCYGERVLFE